MRRGFWLGLIGIILLSTVCFPQDVQAARIRVSQESSPGAGDFDNHVLGTVEAFDLSNRSAAEIYAYSESYYYSYGERGPALRDDTSLIFFAHTSEGLVLFVVHDRVDDPDGGVAVMRLKVEGDAPDARILVYDDPHGQRDYYEILEDDRLFISRQMWNLCCTDGVVLGPFTGLWRVLAEFLQQDDYFGTETLWGLQHWTVLSADGAEVPLQLEKGRRVRLDPIRSLARMNAHNHLSRSHFTNTMMVPRTTVTNGRPTFSGIKWTPEPSPKNLRGGSRGVSTKWGVRLSCYFRSRLLTRERITKSFVDKNYVPD